MNTTKQTLAVSSIATALMLLNLSGCGAGNYTPSQQGISTDIPDKIQVGQVHRYHVKYFDSNVSDTNQSVLLHIKDEAYSCLDKGKALAFDNESIEVTVNDATGSVLEVNATVASQYCHHNIVLSKTETESTLSTHMLRDSSGDTSVSVNTSVVSTFYITSESKGNIYKCSANYENGNPVLDGCPSYMQTGDNHHPRGIAITSDNNTLYAAVTNGNAIWKCDLTTQSCSNFISNFHSSEVRPYDVAFAPNEDNYLYVVNNNDDIDIPLFSCDLSSTTCNAQQSQITNTASPTNLVFQEVNSSWVNGYIVNYDTMFPSVYACAGLEPAQLASGNFDLSLCGAVSQNPSPAYDLAFFPYDQQTVFLTDNSYVLQQCRVDPVFDGIGLFKGYTFDNCFNTEVSSVLNGAFDMAFDPYNPNFLYITNNASDTNPLTVCEFEDNGTLVSCGNYWNGNNIKNAYGIAFLNNNN